MNLFSRLAKSFRDVRDNKVVLMAMIRRNTAGRYKSSYVGFIWHLLLPVLMIVVLTITFTYIRPRPLEDFWIYLAAGMFPVTFISSSLRGRAVLSNAKYLTKMKIPREIVVIASVLTDFLGVVFAYMFIIIVILLSGQYVNWFAALMLPVELFLMLVFSLGCSFLVSTVTVFVKDVGYFMSVAMRLVIWITPTFFLASEAKGLLGTIVWYNPFTYYVEVFHDILYYGIVPHAEYVIISAVLSVVFFLVGTAVFFRYENKFPEVL
ncbi:MAG: ABC transporter permease [Candidatus Methanomethylophilaceae archaeon]|nr:ABC transporter permease [Candidatus Methanomethylophilaceae archaeon]